MHKTALRSVIATGMVLAAGIALTACSASTTSSGGSSAAPAIGTNLSKVCPSTISIQTDWNPEADHGQLYEMVGPNPTIDAKNKTVTGDLYSGGKPTGVKIKVLAGGPAIGYQTVSSELYKDKSIYLAYISTDEAVQFSDKLPTTAVMAENDISPQMIMWDPATYPKVKTIAELGKSLKPGGTVRYFNGAAYMSYLQGS
ncbi:MAG: transporter substrate-binding protein, partial [Microbacteriaceae bacterium]|nr:transporter substrate-binding protein [Microbacteriaceae bacterium]